MPNKKTKDNLVSFFPYFVMRKAAEFKLPYEIVAADYISLLEMDELNKLNDLLAARSATSKLKK